MIFSSRVIYGCPIFMTVTPSERHSGLCIRMMRYRRNDPGMTSSSAAVFGPWIGSDVPSLRPADPADIAEIDLPEYDLRRSMTGKDPLCCLLAFRVMVETVLPNLYGWRMCPRCPDCALSVDPCMDIFGSNATPMGGSLGRADAAVGAVEAQKAEGVLHVHLFLFLQMVHQFCTLVDLATKLREGFLSVEAMKQFVSTARCAAYPDVDQFERERDTIEQSWPAFASDASPSRAPAWAFDLPSVDVQLFGSEWLQEGLAWERQYKERLQHTSSRMNHHIHPICNSETRERRPLASCTTKAHGAGDVQVGERSSDRKLSHSDIDLPFIRNQALRLILIDEACMIPDDLLGAFGAHFEDAAVDSIFSRRANGRPQVFAGYNLAMFGDMLQLPPIPSSAALFLPPMPGEKTQAALSVLNMFLGNDADSMNFFIELTQQMRIDEDWYNILLSQCRRGDLSEEMYNFLMGLPTEHCGSWMPPEDTVCKQNGPAADTASSHTARVLPSGNHAAHEPNGIAAAQPPKEPEANIRTSLLEGTSICGTESCLLLPSVWREMAQAERTWEEMRALECAACRTERERRNRLLASNDKRVLKEPFLSAPYVHKNNEPKYHAMLIRAVEDAKRSATGPHHVLWVIAQDVPQNPKEVARPPAQLQKQRERFLQFHGQRTAGIPGMLPLFVGMRARVTEKIARGKDSQGEPSRLRPSGL